MLRTPSIVVAALQPLPMPVGGLVLQPLTVGHCLLLDRRGVPALLNAPLVEAQLFEALFILSRPQQASVDVLARGEAAWNSAVVESCRATAAIKHDVLALLVRIHCQAALAPFSKLTPPQRPGEDSQFEPLGGSGNEGNGLGWVLNLVAEYQSRNRCWDWRTLLDLPVATGAVLNTAARICEGFTWTEQPSYQTRDRLDAEAALARETEQGAQGHVESQAHGAPAGNDQAKADQAEPAENQHEARGLHAGKVTHD